MPGDLIGQYARGFNRSICQMYSAAQENGVNVCGYIILSQHVSKRVEYFPLFGLLCLHKLARSIFKMRLLQSCA